MKKRILSFVLVFALVCAMSMSAFAGSVYDFGYTLGGNSGRLYCEAELKVSKGSAEAETSNSVGNPAMCTTVATLYCRDSAGNEAPYTAQGTSSVTVFGNSNGIRGGSHHLVSGGTSYGAWSCTLRADV